MTAAQDLTVVLGGHWLGRSGSARCPAHEDRHPSLSIADGRDGRLLLHCFAGCSFAAITDALINRGVTTRCRPSTPAPEEEAKREAEMRMAVAKRARLARDLWDASRQIQGSPAEAYLRSRGLEPPSSGALRFHPATWHSGTARFLPAMIAAVTGTAFAVHRTYLQADGSGKADVEPTRAMLGPVMGGAVRLRASPRGPLLVAEGIETALSAGVQSRLNPAIWAALSAPGLAGLELPHTPGELIVATDGDAAGRDAGDCLAHRAFLHGWTVSVLAAPTGTDWNDRLREGINT